MAVSGSRTRLRVEKRVPQLLRGHSTVGRRRHSTVGRRRHSTVGRRSHSTVGRRGHSAIGRRSHSTVGRRRHSAIGRRRHSAIRHSAVGRRRHSTVGRRRHSAIGLSTVGRRRHSAIGRRRHSAIGRRRHSAIDHSTVGRRRHSTVGHSSITRRRHSAIGRRRHSAIGLLEARRGRRLVHARIHTTDDLAVAFGNELAPLGEAIVRRWHSLALTHLAADGCAGAAVLVDARGRRRHALLDHHTAGVRGRFGRRTALDLRAVLHALAAVGELLARAKIDHSRVVRTT
jgi:hypothetical protein